MTVILHVLPHAKDHYNMGRQYELGIYLFNHIVLGSYGIQDVQPKMCSRIRICFTTRS